MTDYPELYKRLAQEIIKAEGKIGADTSAFVKAFTDKLRAQGYQFNGEAEAALNNYLTDMQAAVKTAISQAVVIGSGLELTKASMQSDAVLAMTEQAFVERWPDGLKLSDRLWRWDNAARDGVQAQLQAGIRQGKASGSVLYDMQRAIERNNGGQRFKIVSDHASDWVEELHKSAQDMIHNPVDKAGWQKVVDDVESRIAEMSRTGNRHAAERLLSQIKTAVDKGKEALLDNAVKWWTYDQQLYHLNRIVRTEMATAMHRAVIDSTIDDETIIGYQWRLSSSHPVTDICDYYANIEMGLGKGVFTKETVPRHKAHPHCMCLLQPRVTPIKQQGSKNYAEFIQNTSPERRDQLLPKWVKELNKLGMPLERLVKGNGLLTRAALKEQMGEEKFNAAKSLSKALAEKQWPINKLKRNMPMTKATLASLQANAHVEEVGQFLAKLERNAYKINSNEWHYFRYKYHFNDPLSSPDELNRRFDRVLQDADAEIHSPGNRLVVISKKEGRLALAQADGARISVYAYTDVDLANYGEPLWRMKDLIM